MNSPVEMVANVAALAGSARYKVKLARNSNANFSRLSFIAVRNCTVNNGA